MSKASPSYRTSRNLAIAGLAAAAVYFVLMRHWEHLVAFAPYLVFLACPLMHLFMHGGHGRAAHDAHADHPGGDTAHAACCGGGTDGEPARRA